MSNNITLIFSRHEEDGNCTANALLQIIKLVQPDVIFEELSEFQYKKAYEDLTLDNLESVAIRNYVVNHDVPHIPVDTFKRPTNHDINQVKMWDRLKSGVNQHSFHLRSISEQLQNRIFSEGFHFLNSKINNIAFEKIDNLKQELLDFLKDEELTQMAKIDQEVIESREDVMLNNVYKYAKENSFSNGLMFIGSGHRKSIMKKIAERNKIEDIKINWQYLSDLKNFEINICNSFVNLPNK